MKVFGLFSGIGGFELGLQQAGMEIGAYCEIEDYCLKVLRKNFPNALEYNDITKLTLQEGEFDVMCGGFPCQDISISGKNTGLLGGERSSLWLEYRRLINEARPKYAIIENVNAILSRGLEIVLQQLAEIGYDATWTNYDSKYFGVPQRRRRTYIIAVRDGIPTHSNIFDFEDRDSRFKQHKRKVETFDQGFEWDFTKVNQGEQAFTYLTRQRSDQFAEIGLASTLTKRDYKDFTDLVVTDTYARRIAPNERLLLQGFPIDWWDGCDLTNTQKYMCNGMTVPVIKHIGELLMRYDSNV